MADEIRLFGSQRFNERQYVLPGRQGAIGSVGCGATGPISSQRWRDGPISLLRKTIEEVGPTLCMIGKAMQAQHQAAAPRFEDREIEPVGANRPLTDPVSGLRVLPPVF